MGEEQGGADLRGILGHKATLSANLRVGDQAELPGSVPTIRASAGRSRVAGIGGGVGIDVHRVRLGLGGTVREIPTE